MKFMITVMMLAFTSTAMAGSGVRYLCQPYKNDLTRDIPPKDAGLPETFEVVVGEKATPKNLDIKIVANNKVFAITAFPFSNNVPNAVTFDRVQAKGFDLILLQKTIYKKPKYFTTKLQYEVDAYHSVNGWYGYACNMLLTQ